MIEAQRVPPSAWITSQSTVICRSPVITSYSIHYTKLYEILIEFHLLRDIGRWDVDGFVDQQIRALCKRDQRSVGPSRSRDHRGASARLAAAGVRPEESYNFV